MAKEVVAWDSCIIIDAISKTPDKYSAIVPMLLRAESGDLRIVISMASVSEVLYVRGLVTQKMRQEDPNDLIRRWFNNEYLALRNVDFGVGLKSAELRRHHRGLTPVDSIILATAFVTGVTTLVTYDRNDKQGKIGLLNLDKKLGPNAPRICRPEEYTINPQLPL